MCTNFVATCCHLMSANAIISCNRNETLARNMEYTICVCFCFIETGWIGSPRREIYSDKFLIYFNLIESGSSHGIDRWFNENSSTSTRSVKVDVQVMRFLECSRPRGGNRIIRHEVRESAEKCHHECTALRTSNIFTAGKTEKTSKQMNKLRKIKDWEKEREWEIS